MLTDIKKRYILYTGGDYMKTKNIKVVECVDYCTFETEVNELLQENYSILSTSCGNTYRAILIHK